LLGDLITNLHYFDPDSPRWSSLIDGGIVHFDEMMLSIIWSTYIDEIDSGHGLLLSNDILGRNYRDPHMRVHEQIYASPTRRNVTSLDDEKLIFEGESRNS